MFTVTKDLVLPCTVTGSWPRPRWFGAGLRGRPLDTCLLDVRFREEFLDAMATVLGDQERAGLDLLTHGDLHLDDDLAGGSWFRYPLQRWAGLEGDHLQPEETRPAGRRFPPGTLLNEIYTGWRWPRVVDTIRHRPLDYPKIWRIAQARARKPVRFGTVCTQVAAPYLDIHTPKYRDKREVTWDLAGAMNRELRALRDAGCRSIQVEEPALHFRAGSGGGGDEEVEFLIEAFNREVEGLDDVEIWIHTCWGNPNMQRVTEETGYRASFDLYLHRCRGDVWTVEMADRDLREIELFGALRGKLPKKVAVGVVSHRTLQVERPEEVADRIRRALRFIAPEQLIVTSDCGFGRQGMNREIAFFKTAAIAEGCNIVRRELDLPTTPVPAADPRLQTDVPPARTEG